MIKMHSVYHEYGADEQGNIYSFKSGKALPIRLAKCSSGYSNFSPSVKGKAKTLRAHRFIMEIFVGPSELQVNHIDGNKRNNSLSNLEYVTPSENLVHAWSLGLISSCPGTLSNEDREFIIRAHGQLSKKYLARKFKVDPTTILRVWRKSA